jgi:glycosyltransferase involved in cell wall biosynthesis
MKLVAVSRVQNEADIIEAFIRHHAAYFQKLIVLDDGSSDGTYGALQSLQAEGLPLVVLQSSTVGYEQSRYMTRLLRIAVDQFGADWIVPLDADEFVEPEDGKTLEDVLSGQEEIVFSIAWHNFEWRSDDADHIEPNPVRRQRFRLPLRLDLNKVIIPARFVDEDTQLSQGNHRLVRHGKPLPHRPLESINLGHFPIRSVQQYASKIAVGYLKYAAMPNWDRAAGFHYIEPFETLLAGGLDALKRRMPMDSRLYSLTPQRGQSYAAVSVDQPLRYSGGELKLSVSNSDVFQIVLHYAAKLSSDRADVLRRLQTDSSAGGEVEKGPFAVDDDTIAGLDEPTSVKVESLRYLLRGIQKELERLRGDKFVLERRFYRIELELLDARQKLFVQGDQLNSRTFKLLKCINDYLARVGMSPRQLFAVFSKLK